MFTLYQRCLACICRRSRCRASTLTGTREACRVVSVGQNWRLDCNRSLHSAAELVPGRSIDTVSFCGWAPCHAEAALCEYTSCNIPSSRMGNFFVMSSSSMASQSTLAFATKMGWKPSALIFHFWIRHVTSRAREPLAASFRSKMCGAWYLWAPTEWAHPGAAPFPPQRTQKAYVQCGLRRFPHEGFRWCWFSRTTLYLPPFQGVVPSQHSSILGVGLLWPDCTLSGGTSARTSTAG